jgi:hypothetical protein
MYVQRFCSRWDKEPERNQVDVMVRMKEKREEKRTGLRLKNSNI